MKVSRSAIIIPLFLFAFLLSTEKLLAAPAPPPGACLVALDSSADRAFQIAGAQSVYTACGIVVNSTKTDGFEMEGSETLYLQNHAQVSVVGGAQLNGQTVWDTMANRSVSPVQTASLSDPLASIPAPTSGSIVGKSATYYDMNSKPKNNTISPGVYCGGLSIGNTGGTTFTFSPGVYVLAGGGLTFNSQAVVAGTGITFYNTSSSGWGCSGSSNYTPVTISGQVTATLTAPTSGTYSGILFFGNRTGCSTKGSCTDQINGGSTAILNGALYFASDEIMITGSNASGYMELVADKIYINGNSNFGNNGNPFDGITVSVSPSTVTLAANQTQQFTATVANTANTAVTWTISPSVGSISSSGLYTAPSSITAQQTITVTATSQTDTSKTGTATITLTPPVAPTIAFSVANQTYGVAPFTVAATSNSSGSITYSVVSGPATISGSTVTVTGVGTVVLHALQAASGNYTAGTANASFTVSGEAPTITFSVSNKTYGVVPFTVAATSNSSGSFTYSAVSGPATISGSTVTITGTGTVVLQASQTASGNYAAGTQNATFTVAAEAPTITFSVANQTFGVSPFTVAATSNSSGAFTYSVISGPATISGSTVSISGIGTVMLQASQVASGNYAPGTQNASFPVSAEAPAITFTVANQTYVIAPFTVAATSNSSGAITYSVVSGPATITGSTVTITGVGTVVLQASQAASGNYTTGAANATFTVAAEAPTITFAVANQTYGAAPFTVSATSNSSGAITYSVASGPATISGSTVTITGVGNVVLQASQAASGNYTAGIASAPFTVAAEAPTISFTVASQTYGAAPFTVSTTSNSPGAITYSVISGPATISGSTVTVTGVGTVVLQASQAAAGNYTAGTQTASFTVSADAPTITFTVPKQTYGVAPFTVIASSNSSGAITYSVVSGPATISGSTVTITGVGTVVLQASQAASGNYTAGTQNATFTVASEAQTIAFTAPASPVTYGVSPITLSATASSGLTVTFNVVSGPATVSGSTLTITGPGTVVVAANQPGNDEYGAAPQVTQSIVVNPSGSITVAPSTATLNAGQTQQFTATVSNASNTVVIWTISPTGTGSINASGLYTAPASIPAQQLVTITAASQANNQATATATVTLMPKLCTGSGFAFGRAIIINHTQVQNTDQINFPVLFKTTDPLLATTANGGHVSNPNGYDIIFTSDAAGQNPLSYEMEEYNPQTGQLIAWVQIPAVSHTQDTTIYIFYGNPGITASQQNPPAVWDPNYLGVWHVANSEGQVSLADSTSNQNNATTNGVTATAGQIDGGMATNGTSYATVGALPNLENTLSGTATYSVWVNPSVNTTGGIFGEDWPGWSIGINNGDFAEVELGGQGVGIGTPISPGVWSYLTVTITQITQVDGTQVSYGAVYLNGVLVQGYPGNPVTTIQQTLAENPTATTYLGLGPSGFGNSQSAVASEDEFRISNIARSPEWIATEYANQSSPSTFYSLSPEGLSVSQNSVSLYQGQTQQFTVSFVGKCPGHVSWSISPAGSGTIDQTGLYSAPATIVTQQTVTVTAASGSTSASTTVTLIPPVAVSVSPATATIANGGQPLQFGSTVQNTGNTTVTWTISPAGAGTIDGTGLYTAPTTIPAQQSVTVTATSQADPSKSASATIALLPPTLPAPPCASNGYSFVRPIVIDHTKIPNTDQANFPFLFNTTDPSLATTANGGHIANFDGDDILFSADPVGQNQLNYELEEYNPVTGQVIAWVRIPTLSHTTDTVIYMHYGNPSVAAPQQSPPAVWDANFMSVWHVANGTQLSLADSTSNGNNATNNGAMATAGQVDGGMQTAGQTYATIGSQANLANLGHSYATFSAWVNNTGRGGIVLGKAGFGEGGWTLGLNESNTPELILYDADGGGNFPGGAPLASGWNYVVATTAQSAATPSQSQVSLYVNGVLSASGSATFSNPIDDTAFPGYLAWNDDGGDFDDRTFGSVVGALDEFRISNVSRSPDWIAAEYYNQASPSTFYALYPENIEGALPATDTLYASQSEQFAVTSLCFIPAVSWSMPPGAPGILTAGGLYTAPAGIDAQQSVVVTAISQADGSTVGSANLTLMPPLSVSVNPSTPTIYAPYETLQFTANLTNATNTAVTWTSSPVGIGAISASGLYTAPWFNTQQTVTITATSQADPTKSASTTLTLTPVTVTPDYISGYGGFSQQFTPSVPVSWSVNPASVGTISASGLFTPSVSTTSYQFAYITATSLADPNASTLAYVYVYPAASISPLTATLFGGQTKQFFPCMATSPTSMFCSPSLASWSVTPAGAGSVSSSGLYTAPLAISSTQTVLVTATDLANPLISVSATITLTPPVVSVTPVNATLYGGQTEQFFAQVTNSPNTRVTWSIAPDGVGSISSSGLYSAPIGITSQQTVTITAISQAVPSISASAVVNLSPTQCAAKAYRYVRSISIDHTRVPNTDQVNFPFMFSATDPTFASVDNGGHVASPSGYDILFSSDPAGVNRLDYEIQDYSPVTGQILAWIRIPAVAHASDTLIYMFYGDTSITAPQQNPGGVWQNGYQSVYHLANAGSGIAVDSTSYGNNVPTIGLTSTPGGFDAGAVFNGSTSYIALPTVAFSSYPTSGQYSSAFAASLGVWFKTSSEGVILGQAGGTITPGSYPNGWIPALYVDNSGNLRGSFFNADESEETNSFWGTGISYTGAPQLVAQGGYNDNLWHFAALTSSNNGTENLYVDGKTISTNQNTVQAGYNPTYTYSIGTGFDLGWPNVPANANWLSNWNYFNGALQQVEVSNVARSEDWLVTEYLNQSSPATFSALSPELSGGASLGPLATSLSAMQSQQFTVLEQGFCGPGGAAWSMPAGSPGILSSSGLYTAPPDIDKQQTVKITATTLGDQSTKLSATVTLLPPTTIGVTPLSASLAAGQAQQFTATVNNASNTAVSWSISPAGAGTITGSGLYTAPATPAVQTVVVTATSVADTAQSASATITLALPLPPATISLTPPSAVLYAGQSQQLTASVSNATTTAVTWAIDPIGAGTISASGLYTAPSTISTQQTVTITATSQADSSLIASAMISLAPTPCASSGYGYVHAIVINHNQVPNTDQTNFPVVFNTIDPTFASVANGGHVSNANGYDIIFSTDPNGLTKLDHELEQYNPVNGQVIAWVRIPILSHTSDTTLYVFYGNPNVSTPQQNPTGVWDINYEAVYHLANSPSGIATDSTANANNGIVNNVSPVSGETDGAASFDGATSFIQVPIAEFPTYPANASTSDLPLTFAAWFQTTTGGVILGQTDGTQPGGYPNGWAPALYVDNGGYVRASMFFHGSVSRQIVSANTYTDGNWHYAVDTYSNGTETLYVDGNRAGFQQNATEVPNGAPYAYFLGTGETNAWPATPGGWFYFGGNLDEVRVSSATRSSDWIATEFNNQSSPGTFYSFYGENTVQVVPAAVTLYAGQSQQFTAPGACSSSVAWSMPSSLPGTLSSSGLYTAPGSIASEQTVTVTATAPGGGTNTATVTLLPPVSVNITPASATLSESQNVLLTPTVSNSANQAVNWIIYPTGAGSIDASGLYVAPSTITTQQTVTIVAISQEDSAKSTSATITLLPTQCASIGYGYQRVMVVDHNKVPNSDQINFPLLFNTTDPDLASVSYGGHVTSPSGYDIFFSTDPNGQTKLDHEIEEYNPATGQVVAWIRIPTLSHSIDTLVYVFYGNPNITSTQQNPAGVWNSDYQAVYHLANTVAGTAIDATVFNNAGTLTSVSAAAGEIDGASGFNGSSSYMEIPSADFPNYPNGAYNNLGLPNSSQSTSFAASFGAWFKTASAGGILAQVPSIWTGDCFFFICFTGPTVPGDYDPAGWNSMLYVDDNGYVVGAGITTSKAYNDNQWHFAAVTYATDGTDTLYVDGQSAGSTPGNFPPGYSSAYSYFVGTSYTFLADDGNWNWLYLNGTIDEVTVSDTPLSADWIQTEYNNQSSPATFYQYTTVSTAQILPASIGLYANQAQQFAVPGACIGSVVWSTSAGAPGSLSATGLYTAPSAVSSQQAVTITATSQATGTAIGNASVTLLAPPQAVTLAANGQQPYQTGTPQTFTATILDQQGNPQIGVTVGFVVAGANSAFGNGTTNSYGLATYSYTGANSGSDTVVASASVSGQPLTSNTVIAAWVQPIATAPVAGVTLLAPPTLGVIGLAGAFTDGNGAVIEPIAIGASAREFVVPGGATQLQLGVNSEFYIDDGGSGFNVTVNGTTVAVPPTAMPWIWTAGGLNTNYQYGIYNPSIQNGALDGTPPVIAARNLSAGQVVSIAYQSGLASANLPVRPLVNANGDPTWTPGVGIWQGTHFPTLYMTTSAYPIGQPISFSAQVTDSTGAPEPNVPVTLNITGANPQQLQATSDSTGTAVFLYTGTNTGTDTLEALANPADSPVYTSTASAVVWVSPNASSPAGSLALSLFGYVNDFQDYVVVATDANGNPVTNAKLGFYVWGVDNFSTSGMTDVTGHASFGYNHTDSGTYNLVAVESVGGNVIFSNAINGVWTMATSTNTCNFCNQISVSINALSSIKLPNSLTLTGTVTDNVGITPTMQWTQVSGPGVVTFATPQQAVTTATFSAPGVYVVQLYGSDTGVSATSTFQVTVNPAPLTGTPQGWIASPIYGSPVTGIVAITLAPGETLQSGSATLVYASTSNLANVTPISITANSGQIAQFDTTMLPNGSYWIQLNGTDSSGNTQQNLLLVTVTGNYKPGRLTTTVTDLVVPATGLPISIQRSYDSLNAGTSGDFGYGWNLGINVNLVVDPVGNVTFTLGGQRRTFYLAPQMPPCTALGCLFPYYFVNYTPEPGLHGTLTAFDENCTIGILVPNGNMWSCQGGGYFNPQQYTYTDVNGTSYNIAASGSLQSINDRSGNGLSITPNGITSTTGLNVPFVRDAQNRITQITDPQGNIYSYTYDQYGNLATVTYPATPQPSTYTYAANHYYLSGTDFRNNPLPSVNYYTATDTDVNGLPLNGRIESVTNAVGNTTGYAYNLETNTTTITNPPDARGNIGTATTVYDSNGNLLQSTDPLGHTTTNSYDSNFNLLSTADPLGHTTSYTYDANGNKTSQTYQATATSTNTTIHATYGQYGAPLTYTDENGNTRTFSYDGNGNPAGVTDTINGHTAAVVSSLYGSNGLLQAVAVGADLTETPSAASTFTYDANGNTTSATNPLGNTTLYAYDSLGRVISLVRKGGASSTSSAESASGASPMAARALTNISPGNRQRASASVRASSGLFANQATARPSLQPRTLQQGSDPSSSLPGCNPSIPQAFSVTYYYSAMDGVGSEVDSLGRSASATYDANGNMITNTDANGNTYQYTYDALNRLTNIALPTQPATGYSFTYDSANNVIDAVDPEGHDRHNVYDLAGRLTSVTIGFGTAGATTTNFSYNSDGTLQSVTDALNHSTSYSYDAAKNLTQVVRGNVSVQYAYDNARNRISATDGNGNVTTFQYDARQRLQQIGFADQTQQSINYDDANNVTSVVDQAGHTVDYGYDTSNNLVSVTQANSPYTSANTVNYCRDGLGNLAWSADANGHVTYQTADVLGRPTSLTYPDGTNGLVSSHDGNSNLISLGKTSAAGSQTATFAYDSLNRLTSETPDPSYGEPAINFVYTANGLLSKMTDGAGVTSYTYDALDRLTSKTTPAGTLNYTYDSVGNVASMSSGGSSGVSVSYTYDNLNRLSTVVDNTLPTGQNTTAYSYDPASNLATAKYPNGLQAVFTYDQLNRLSQASTPVSGYQYQRDANGNILAATEATNRSVNYTYDGLDQLTAESVLNDPSQVDGSISYSLDPVGNRLSDQSTLGPIGSSSTTFSADDQSQAETYDASGDTITTGGNTYAYNSWLKLTSMNGGQVRLVYNGLGQLVSKTANGVNTQYLIDDLSPMGYPQVVEELVNGQVTRQYTYGLERISELQMVNNAPTASFYQYDGRGTVRMLTNAAGAVTDAYEYDAFGNLISSAGTTPNVYLYRGERYDADLGLYYLRARWYNPVTDRFMTRDPYEGSIYDPASLNRYNYARANPVNFIDPSGRAAKSDYVFLALNALAEATAVTAAGEAIGCAYYALASATDLVGQHIGQQIDQLGLLWQGCEARITVKQHLIGIGTNLLGIGVGRALGAGIGWLLENAEQGLGWRLLAEEEGSLGPQGPGLAERAAQVRKDLDVGAGRNIAVARYSIDGQSGELVAVSGQAARQGTVDAPLQQIFDTIQTGDNPRTLDSEYKILSAFAAQLTPTSRGVIDLYSELPLCVSCNGVLNQFEQLFPNVIVNVVTGSP